MALDKLLIGTRIREIRDEKFGETRKQFAERCGLTETHVGQIERGEILISLSALDKIIINTGSSADYILYGVLGNKSSPTRIQLDNYLNTSDEKELKLYFKHISSMRTYIENYKDENNKN